VPVLVGTVQLVGLIRRTAVQGRTPRPRASALGVAAMFLAMSADSVAVLGPLVADTLNRLDAAVLVSWMVMGGVWTRLAGWVAGHPRVAIAAERYGAWIGPVLMIIVGLYILLDTPTDVMPG
jgi:cadmium resistance protein CadD (predicted permease)